MDKFCRAVYQIYVMCVLLFIMAVVTHFVGVYFGEDWHIGSWIASLVAGSVVVPTYWSTLMYSLSPDLFWDKGEDK